MARRKKRQKLTARQSELRWIRIEREKRAQKRLDKYHVELSNKTKEKLTMSVTINGIFWKTEDLRKLKSNKHRPVSELLGLFKYKFTVDQLEAAREYIKTQPATNRRQSTLVTEAEFKTLYAFKDSTLKTLYEKHPNFCSQCSKHTISWYLLSIRRELRGVRTRLADKFYELLLQLAQTDSIEVPERGSAGNSVKDYSKSKIRKSRKEVPANESNSEETISDTASTIASEIKTEGTPCVHAPSTPNYSDIFSPNATLKFGLAIGNDIRVIGDSIAYIEGAESVYKQLGFVNQLRRVKLLVEPFE